MTGAADLHGTRTIPGSTPDAADGGVCFPLLEGRESTTVTCRELLADAAAPLDTSLENRIRACQDWRAQYVTFLRELTAVGRHGQSALTVADRGLASMRGRMQFERSGERRPLAEALELAPGGERSTGTIHGAAAPERTLRVPYRGEQLEGHALAAQLKRWVAEGTVEPAVADAVAVVAANPDWLSLSGRRIVLFGAASEIGPLGPLSRWGADVLALDLPGERIWSRVREIARTGAGTLRMPLDDHGAPGLDLIRELPETAAWLQREGSSDPLVLGMYAYADGGAHVRATAAFDLLATHLRDHEPALSFLATPTDAYVVPDAAVEHARRRYRARRLRRIAQAPLQLASGGRLFAPAYAGGEPVVDSLIKQQGPNYAIAKRLQRWRGLQADHAGSRVSFNVAPATWTRSVTRNRVLAAAYGGAHRFGIEVFRADTTRALMAALLVYDLNRDPAPRQAPETLFSDGAAHGGLWRAAYQPRSVLSLAALAGLPRTLAGGGR